MIDNYELEWREYMSVAPMLSTNSLMQAYLDHGPNEKYTPPKQMMGRLNVPDDSTKRSKVPTLRLGIAGGAPATPSLQSMGISDETRQRLIDSLTTSTPFIERLLRVRRTQEDD